MHFYALTCLSSMLYITKHRIRRENKSTSTQEKAESTKREQSIRPFETEKEDRDGKVLTCRTRRRRRIVDQTKKTKRHKKENNPINTFLPFKTEKKKNGKDGKVLTRRARRRERFVNRSPR